MNTYFSINKFKSKGKTVVTLGTFDGVHKGHQSIIEKVVGSAKFLGAESLLLTFFPHPRMVLKKDEEVQLLNTITEKADLLEKWGLDHLVVHEFDQEFANLTAEEFVKKVLVEQFNVVKIVIGYDHRFGKNRSANIEDLEFFGKKYGFEVEQISAQEIENLSVSSTKIRKALSQGNIETANAFLGYAYYFTGKVVEGKKIGRTIGFPTANIQISESYKLIPRNGVYIVSSEIDGRPTYGMMNIGTNPTIGENPRTIEVHFLNFSGDLYGKILKIAILTKIRDEKKFDSFDSLKKAIENDKQTTESYIENVGKIV